LGYIKDSGAKRVTIVGGGFIGLELAESFLQLDMEITIVEKMGHILPSLDLEMAEMVAAHLRDKGTKIITSDNVKSFSGDANRGVRNINTEHGGKIASDLVLLSVGVEPNVNLAREARVAIGPTKAIAVDDHMQTNLPDIYAAGDCAETRNIVTGEVTWMPLGSIAQKQGRVAGENAAGGNATFPGVLGTTIAKVCELTVAKTGLSQEEAEQRGLRVISSTIHPFDHAHYYPEAHEIALKLVADKETGRLLGAQAVGKGGVDRSIDVLAVAIFKGAIIEELGCLDLAYSPPYSTAKDAVNIAGNVITNKYTGIADSTSSAELKSKLESGSDFTLLDVRSNVEYQAGHLPRAKLIPIWELRKRLTELEDNKEIITFCSQGLRAYLAYRILKNSGFTRVTYHDGGIASWPYEVK
jgi:NADPH-dependent 2,4-dienoyl-CoA reductase/sulfur reductase-like enzyme/rhodanese-related sulfurtransferase